MIYKPTLALTKIAEISAGNKINVVQGGQGASKTISILMMLINQSYLEGGLESSILGNELTKLKLTVVRDFKKIMISWNRFEPSRFTRDSHYEFENGSYIEFLGLDRIDIGKGLRRDYLYFNEANRGIKFETYRQAASRCRRKVFIDFNPDAEFWVHDEVLPRKDSGNVILTYKDNEYLPYSEREEVEGYKDRGFFNPNLPIDDLFQESNIKNHFWANKWRVYGLGLTGKIEGLVFPDYEIVDKIPKEAKKVAYGLDFGFTNDPTALVKVVLHEGKLKAKQLLYKKRLTNQDICKEFERLGLSKNDKIIADSAEPKSIAEIRKEGWNIKGCVKGRDSIKWGIQKINEYGIQIERTSSDFLEEARNYKYGETTDGKPTNKPIDNFNHCWDALRYAIESIVRRQNSNWNVTTRVI